MFTCLSGNTQSLCSSRIRKAQLEPADMAHLFNQATSNKTIAWQSDSDIRGSWSILSTCTITLCLGVWSAVHLNLPANPASLGEALRRRTGWAFCSLLAPEILILVAWTQRTAAKRVQEQVQLAFATSTEETVSCLCSNVMNGN